MERKISIDERNAEIRKLRGKLTNKRIAKRIVGGQVFCICPECLAKINEECNPKEEAPKKEAPKKAKTDGNKET